MADVIDTYSPQPRKTQPALSFLWTVPCQECFGWGWYTKESYEEYYCSCEAGKWRRIYDGGTADEHYAEAA